MSPNRRLTVLISVVCSAAVLCLVAAGSTAATYGLSVPPLWRLIAVLALSGAAWALPVDLRPGRSGGLVYAWGETALLVGAWLLGPVWVIPATAAGVGVVLLARRQALPKAGYNTATYTVAAAAAGAVLHLTGVPLDRIGWPQVVALAAAGVAFSVVCQLLISTVVAVAADRRLAVVLTEEGTTQLLVMGGNVAVGIAVVFLFDWQHNLLVVLPVAAWALRHAYMTTARLSDAQQTARQLEAITRRMNSLDVATVLASLIAGAAQLFRADRVEVVLDGPAGQGMVGGGRQGVREIDDELDDEFDPAQVHALDLTSGPQTLGQLRLLFAAPVELTGTERGTLATLVATGGSALLNARQHESTAHEASTDTLTGLANRRALLAAGKELADSAAVLLLVDLDRFRDINDTLGHAAGDELLIQVAGRLRAAAGEEALVCRLGGDEFAVLLTDPTDADARGQALAARLSAALAEPAEVDDVTVSVHGSIGVACAPRDAGDVADLLRCADVAMYQAKRAGADVARYQARQQSDSVRSLSLEPDLRAALRADDQLVVLFQPQLDLSTGHAIGAEALVRWRHPLHGVLSPAAFLPTVHRTGLSGQLTRYVLEAALSARTGWQQLTGVDVPVAVNLSAKDLFDPTLPADVGAALARHATAPDRLVLEIPETVVLTELDVITAVLSALAGLGVQLSVDDFCAGGVPLNLLARVPIREIKVDQSFVRTLPTSRTSATIVRAIIQLAHALDVRVVAEGIETAEQEDELRGMGCDAGQGLRYDQPLDAHEAAFALKSPAGVPMPHPGAEVLRMPAGRRRRPS